jgi:nucleoid-associated protein YgaU
MNAMIRTLKGTLAVLALAGVGLLLRWVTAGSISGARTYDLDSLTVLVVGTVAWIAYAWLVLAVVATVLEQIPGVVGELAGAVAGRITTKTARALLRSGLGVAAVTPLTVSAAQATPDHGAHVLQWNQTEPASTIHLTDSNWRAVDAQSASHQQDTTGTWRSMEPASELQVGGSDAQRPTAAQQESGSTWRFTEPASELQVGGGDTQRTTAGQQPTKSQQESGGTWRSMEPASELQIGGADAHKASTAEQPTKSQPESNAAQRTSAKAQQESAKAQEGTAKEQHGSADVWRAVEPGSGLRIGADQDGKAPGRTPVSGRMRVPDRPADGAPTRYTEVRAGGAVRVVVRDGDSLWALAARELGPGASDEAIAARWPEWYAANRQVIGDDPDLILPGQVLRVPPKSTGHLPPTHQEP